MKATTVLASFFVAILLSGCLGSTGPNESCDDFDRQEQAAYIEQYAQNEDVTATDSGLHYRVLEESEGLVPVASDSIEVEFVGRLIDGSIFETTDNAPNPFRFRVENLTMEGLREGLLLMEEGSTYELVVPSELGFGETPSGPICPGTTLIFEVTLVEIF